MRYYFRDNQPNSFARYTLSGIALVTLVAAVGGFNYSRGLPFSSNPFVGSDSWNEARTSDDQNLEKIFIPIRKEFPPDPFHGTTQEAAPIQQQSRAPVPPPPVPSATDTAVASVPGISNAATLKQDLSQPLSEAQPASKGKTALMKDNAGIAASQKLKRREEVREISEFVGVQESVIGQAKNKQNAAVKASGTVKAEPVDQVKALAPDGGARLTKSAPVQDVSESVKNIIGPSPVVPKIDEAPSDIAANPEQPTFKPLETVVEISDSGETVTGKRWKDVSNFSQ